MGFKLIVSKNFWYKVKVTQVNEQGKPVTSEISVLFKRLDLDERVEREDRNGGAIYKQLLSESDGDLDTLSGKFQAELARAGSMDRDVSKLVDEVLEIVDDWKDVMDENGTPIEFNRSNLTEIVRWVPNFVISVNEAYREAYSGALKAGNSKR